jgi:hypothetical protein
MPRLSPFSRSVALATLLLSSPVLGDARVAAAPLADLRLLPSPAAPASAEPHLAVSPEGRVWLSWLEKRTAGGHALRVARLDGARWSKPYTIAEGDSFFANWADFPTVLPLGGERLAAHYLWKTGGETYAYEVRTTRSVDGGRSWSPPVVPHRDGTPTEHGFVSLLPEGSGVRVVWLDGRNAMATDSAGRPVHREEGEAEMTLRTAIVGPDGVLAGEALLDPRACDCCQTAAVATARGVLVAYRDRSAEEIRDISVVRFEDGVWSEPEAVHADGWKIAGCPVNGPSLAAAGDRVAVAWYTAAQDSPRVLLAFSDDGGHRFGAPVRMDGGAPLGRVSALLDQVGGAVVAWLEARGKEALVQVRRVSRDGAPGPVMTVARTAAARASGFPRLVRSGDRVVLAWTEAGKPSQVRTATARVGGGAAR